MGDEAFRRFAKAAIEAHSRTPIDERFWPAFASMLHYHAGGFDDSSHFHALARTIEGLDEQIGGGAHRVFYLSTPSSFFPVIVKGLGAAKLNRPTDLVRVAASRLTTFCGTRPAATSWIERSTLSPMMRLHSSLRRGNAG